MKTLTLVAALCGWLICGLASPALADDINPNTVTNAKLEQIRIPEIKFNQVPLSEAIAYLEKQSLEHDPGPVVTGIQFIYMPPKNGAKEPKLKLSLRNVKLNSALEIICMKTGYNWDFDKGMVVVKPADDPQAQSSSKNPTMRTEVFDINAGVLSRAQAR